jgi:hypothetical protein
MTATTSSPSSDVDARLAALEAIAVDLTPLLPRVAALEARGEADSISLAGAGGGVSEARVKAIAEEVLAAHPSITKAEAEAIAAVAVAGHPTSAEAEAIAKAAAKAAVEPGAWKPLKISAKLKEVKEASGKKFEPVAARLVEGGAACELRGVLEVTTEVKSSAETIFEMPEAAFFPKKDRMYGFGTANSGLTNHVGALMLAATGIWTDDETPVPTGVWYLLDGIRVTLT